MRDSGSSDDARLGAKRRPDVTTVSLLPGIFKLNRAQIEIRGPASARPRPDNGSRIEIPEGRGQAIGPDGKPQNLNRMSFNSLDRRRWFPGAATVAARRLEKRVSDADQWEREVVETRRRRLNAFRVMVHE